MWGGNCIYCGEYVADEGLNFCDRKYDEKQDKYINYDFCHHECFVKNLGHLLPLGITETADHNENQITIDQWLKEVENGFNNG